MNWDALVGEFECVSVSEAVWMYSLLDAGLLALYDMTNEAAVLIDLGLIEYACNQLYAALRKTDGDPTPPDFVTGEAALQLEDMILELMLMLECS